MITLQYIYNRLQNALPVWHTHSTVTGKAIGNEDDSHKNNTAIGHSDASYDNKDAANDGQDIDHSSCKCY